MTTKIHGRSKVEDINTVSTSVLNTLSNYDFSSDVYITTQQEKLKTNTNLMTEAINQSVFQGILAPKDEIRDNSIRVIFYEVKSKMHWPDQTISDAAHIVWDVLDKYTLEVIRMAYNIQSAQINALLQDLKKPEITTHIEALNGLQNLIDMLETNQKDFEATYQEYITQKVDHKELLPAGKLGDQIRDQINNELALYLKAMAQAKPELFEECFNKIDTIITDNNSKVKSRIKINYNSLGTELN